MMLICKLFMKFFIKFHYNWGLFKKDFKVTSKPHKGLKLTALRSGVTCSTNWAGQAPRWFFTVWLPILDTWLLSLLLFIEMERLLIHPCLQCLSPGCCRALSSPRWTLCPVVRVFFSFFSFLMFSSWLTVLVEHIFLYLRKGAWEVDVSETLYVWKSYSPIPHWLRVSLVMEF